MANARNIIRIEKSFTVMSVFDKVTGSRASAFLQRRFMRVECLCSKRLYVRRVEYDFRVLSVTF